MDLFVADDARQNRPTRAGMGPLVAAGGVYVPGGWVAALEANLEGICARFGFPKGEEFKWSPERKAWMYRNLIEDQRERFFVAVLNRARQAGVRAVLVIEDSGYRPANRGAEPEEDVTRMLLERIENELRRNRTQGLVVTDRPGGGRPDEDRFLTSTLEMLQAGTAYVKHKQIALNVLSTPSRLVRLVQLADLVTSCVTAYVAGEARYSPAIAAHVRSLMTESVGGVCVKIHPDIRYMNLYHWLFGDTGYHKAGVIRKLPAKDHHYANDANIP